MSRVLPLLFALVLPVLGTQQATAQPTRLGDTFYLRFGQGTSDLSGATGGGSRSGRLWDPEKVNGENVQYAFILESGYRFSPSLSFGVGYQFSSYYHEAGFSRRGVGNESLHTIQVLTRYKMGGRRWLVSPYIDLGANVSVGTERLAGGPTLGGGLSVTVDNQLSFFVESRYNLAYPNQTSDTGFPLSIQSLFGGLMCSRHERSD